MIVIIDDFELTGYTEKDLEILNAKVVKPKKVRATRKQRCKDTLDWVEDQSGDTYKKPKKGESGY